MRGILRPAVVCGVTVAATVVAVAYYTKRRLYKVSLYQSGNDICLRLEGPLTEVIVTRADVDTEDVSKKKRKARRYSLTRQNDSVGEMTIRYCLASGNSWPPDLGFDRAADLIRVLAKSLGTNDKSIQSVNCSFDDAIHLVRKYRQYMEAYLYDGPGKKLARQFACKPDFDFQLIFFMLFACEDEGYVDILEKFSNASFLSSLTIDVQSTLSRWQLFEEIPDEAADKKAVARINQLLIYALICPRVEWKEGLDDLLMKVVGFIRSQKKDAGIFDNDYYFNNDCYPDIMLAIIDQLLTDHPYEDVDQATRSKHLYFCVKYNFVYAVSQIDTGAECRSHKVNLYELANTLGAYNKGVTSFDCSFGDAIQLIKAFHGYMEGYFHGYMEGYFHGKGRKKQIWGDQMKSNELAAQWSRLFKGSRPKPDFRYILFGAFALDSNDEDHVNILMNFSKTSFMLSLAIDVHATLSKWRLLKEIPKGTANTTLAKVNQLLIYALTHPRAIWPDGLDHFIAKAVSFVRLKKREKSDIYNSHYPDIMLAIIDRLLTDHPYREEDQSTRTEHLKFCIEYNFVSAARVIATSTEEEFTLSRIIEQPYFMPEDEDNAKPRLRGQPFPEMCMMLQNAEYHSPENHVGTLSAA